MYGYGPPHGGGPPSQYPPQGQYGAPPPNQYPPQQYPPQHGYPPQQGYPPQPPYPSQQGYPPSQGQAGGYYGSNASGPPPSVPGYGSPGQYGQGPPPPNMQQHHQYPPQQYAPPPNQYGGPGSYPPSSNASYPPSGPPSAPSPGYGPPGPPRGDPRPTADILRQSMKGFGTREDPIIQALAHFPGTDVNHLKGAYRQAHGRDLEKDIHSETSGYFREGLLAILRGPLGQDVHSVRQAVQGAGTNERLLDDVVVARSNADLQAIKHAYYQTYHSPLEQDVANDLSFKTKALFAKILLAARPEDSTPIQPGAIDQDVQRLHQATIARMGTDEETVYSIVAGRSDPQLREIALAFHRSFGRTLESVLDGEFSGHMKHVLIDEVRAATDRPRRDAMRLEAAMAGAGTKDVLLVERIVAIHWNPGYVHAVRNAYQREYGRDLIQRVRGETSSHYRDLMVAMLQ